MLSGDRLYWVALTMVSSPPDASVSCAEQVDVQIQETGRQQKVEMDPDGNQFGAAL